MPKRRVKERRKMALEFKRMAQVHGARNRRPNAASPPPIPTSNDFASSANLQRTYAPVDVEVMRESDKARRKGRMQ